MMRKTHWTLAIVTVVSALTGAAQGYAQRTQLKAPWNVYSPNTDVQVGKQNADLMAGKLQLCNDPRADKYLTTLGMRLVAKLPTKGVQYPWEFHCVNDKSISGSDTLGRAGRCRISAGPGSCGPRAGRF